MACAMPPSSAQPCKVQQQGESCGEDEHGMTHERVIMREQWLGAAKSWTMRRWHESVSLSSQEPQTRSGENSIPDGPCQVLCAHGDTYVCFNPADGTKSAAYVDVEVDHMYSRQGCHSPQVLNTMQGGEMKTNAGGVESFEGTKVKALAHIDSEV